MHSICSGSGRGSAVCSIRPTTSAAARRRMAGGVQRRFLARQLRPRSELIGKPLRIAGNVVTVVGVTPSSFHGSGPARAEPICAAALPERPRRPRRTARSESRFGFTGIGRLSRVRRWPRPTPTCSSTTAVAGGVRPARVPDCAAPRLGSNLGGQDSRRCFGPDTGAALSDAGSRRHGAPPVLCERQRADALEAARAPARVRGPHGHRRGSLRLARQDLTESLRHRARGRRPRRRGPWYGTPWMRQFFRVTMHGRDAIEPDQTVFLVTALSRS